MLQRPLESQRMTNTFNVLVPARASVPILRSLLLVLARHDMQRRTWPNESYGCVYKHTAEEEHGCLPVHTGIQVHTPQMLLLRHRAFALLPSFGGEVGACMCGP